MKKPIMVTDHALIRYIERAHGIDLTEIRNALRDEVRPAIEAGASSYFDGTVTYMLDGRQVLTVIEGRAHARKPVTARQLVGA